MRRCSFFRFYLIFSLTALMVILWAVTLAKEFANDHHNGQIMAKSSKSEKTEEEWGDVPFSFCFIFSLTALMAILYALTLAKECPNDHHNGQILLKFKVPQMTKYYLSRQGELFQT